MIPYPILCSWFARMRQPRLAIYSSLVLITLLGIANIYTHTSNYGPNITEDSVTYISVAKNLVAGDGFLGQNQGELILYPPGFPLLLGVLASLGADPIEAGRFVNIIGFGIVLCLTYRWLNYYIGNTFLVIIAAIVIASSYPLNTVFSYLLSDSIFIISVVASLISMSRFLKSPDPSWSTLAWSASFTALAATTRYIGVTVILTGIIVIFMHPSRLKIIKKLKYLTFYIAASSILLTIWTIRVYLATGHLWGNREAMKGQSSLIDRLFEIYDVIYFWLWVDDSPGIPYILYQISIVVSIVALVLVGLFIFRRLSIIDLYPSPYLEPLPNRKLTSWKVTLPFILFSLIYLLILPIAASVGSGQDISTRYMAPIYIPVLLVIVSILDRLLHQDRRLTITKWIVIGLIFVGLFSSTNLSLQRNLDDTFGALADDAKINLWGYSSDSDIIRYLRETPINGRIISNESPVTYWLAFNTQTPVLSIPEGYTSIDCLNWVRSLISQPTIETYIIYFTKNRVMACPITELEPILSPYLERITQTSEAIIYRIIDPIDNSLDLGFHVHIHGNTLVYTKTPCSATTNTEWPFRLHIYPVEENDLSNEFGFQNLDFHFNDHGIIDKDGCIVRRPLPPYDISKIRTGQYSRPLDETLNLWEIEITPTTTALPAAK